MIQAVIFDFDGVIVDTEPLHYEAFVDILPQVSLDLPRQTYFDRYVGLADREILRRILTDAGRDVSIERLEVLRRAKDVAYLARISRGIIPLAGVPNFVSEAARRRPVAICSGAKRVEIELILKSIGLRDHFKTIVTSDDVMTSKPNPEGYLLTLQHLRKNISDLEAGRCLVVEDSVYGIQAAKAAGMQVLAIRTPYNGDILDEADFVVSSLEDIGETNFEEMMD